MSDVAPADKFRTIQLGWISVLSQPGMMDVFDELNKPVNATMREGSDLTAMMSEKGVQLPAKSKASLIAAAGDQPLGAKICLAWSSSPTSGAEWHCLVVRSPFQNPFSDS